jgi:hypothetical protein
MSAHQSVFVVTYGRSGSTLVQGMLNALPRTLVRGENRLFVLPLFRGHDVLRRHRETYNRPATRRPTSAFYGLDEIDVRALASDIAALVNRQLLGDVDASAVDRLGFKEVVWHRVQPDEREAFFAFLDAAFGEPLYVLNQRDPESTRASGFWQKSEAATAQRQISRVRDHQAYLAESRPDRSIVVHYEAFTSADSAVVRRELTRLATFVLGAEPGAEVLEAVRATLQVAHGPKPSGAHRTDE